MGSDKKWTAPPASSPQLTHLIAVTSFTKPPLRPLREAHLRKAHLRKAHLRKAHPPKL